VGLLRDYLGRGIGSAGGIDRGEHGGEGCECEASVDGDTLRLDADECPGGGDLAAGGACRSTAVAALGGRSVDEVVSEARGFQRAYRDAGVELLVAAGRFADAAAFHDERVARLARREPLVAAREAAGRAGQLAGLGEDTGLVEAAAGATSIDRVLDAFSGPTVSRWRVVDTVPDAATLAAARDLDTGGTVRVYEHGGQEPRHYHLDPLESGLDRSALATLDDAHEHLATGDAGSGPGAAGRAVRAVAGPDAPVGDLVRILEKHTRGHGLLADLFADPVISDAFVTAPATETRVRVRIDGELVTTNVRPTERGVGALSSRFRRESGRAFSRAAPTLDATAEIAGRRVRVAGVTEPASSGEAFAFRAHDRRPWTLPALVDNGTLPPSAAGVLSLAVARGANVLIAGPRGAGKTTLLGAVLWELPATVRTVVIEDAPELPLARLRRRGRDVQGLRAARGGPELDPTAALRTALRLGDGALVVGEVRGEEAAVLYEAMRVGANSEAVLGTIHGTDAAAVRDRVVNDLDVPPASFAATDAIVSLELDAGGERTSRRVHAIEERRGESDGFADLLARSGEGLEPSGRLERGNSRLLATLSRPAETYADVLSAVHDRRDRIAAAVASGRTAVGDLVSGPAR
jgi:type IV secretory pathway ATPase VirB11/archaellum biosynthesis ATPase